MKKLKKAMMYWLAAMVVWKKRWHDYDQLLVGKDPKWLNPIKLTESNQIQRINVLKVLLA